MKAIKLGLLSFVLCSLLGGAIVLLAPPTTQAGGCNTNCAPYSICGGPVGSCQSPYVPYNDCYPELPLDCDPDGPAAWYNCCHFVGCGFPC